MNKYQILLLLFISISCTQEDQQSPYKSALLFDFNETVETGVHTFEGLNYSFETGIEGQALSIRQDFDYDNLMLDGLPLNGTKDFTIQFWIKTTSDNPMVILSQKEFINKGMRAQKNSGWVLYSSGGTFAWNIGSGSRRINYERDNGEKMPLSDGQWHQLTMTYSNELSEVRLYYDGHNKAIYKVRFDFANTKRLTIGSSKNDFDYDTKLIPEIETGAIQLQSLVDEFNSLGVEGLEDEEFLSLIVESELLLEKKLRKEGTNDLQLTEESLKKVNEIRGELLTSPYTVHQILEFTEIKPLNEIYSLNDGKVIIDQSTARKYTYDVQLRPADFAMDNLAIWERALTSSEVLDSYHYYQSLNADNIEDRINSLSVGVWNIWHGGKHYTLEEHGWDSRMRIVEILKEKNVDIILMQETYSSGDFIAAELGYYYATTSDRDYRLQGSNISVMSRYPIVDLVVPEEAEFMNIGVKLALSTTQEIYAMSNWYGMASFPQVYDFHERRFNDSDGVPILFGGDFNAVPHTDGGESIASERMLSSGFTDAYRSLHPDVKRYPAHTHNSGVRIDQLYYKGKGLKNTFTEVISTWPGGFPSDHFLILSKFELN